MNQINLALAQTHIIWENKEKNYEKAAIAIEAAKRHDSELILFPEMSFTGFSMNTDITKEKDDITIRKMQSLATEYKIAIGFGWVKDCGTKCENHYTITDSNGAILSDYAKIHPFSYSGEDEKFAGGSSVTAFTMHNIPFSNFICYDLRFPEIFQIVSKEADVIILPANWPVSRSEHWKTLLKARAIENQVYILAINCVGSIGGLGYSGDTCVVNPNGEICTMLSGSEGNLYYTLGDDTSTYRSHFPVKNDRREAFYQALISRA